MPATAVVLYATGYAPAWLCLVMASVPSTKTRMGISVRKLRLRRMRDAFPWSHEKPEDQAMQDTQGRHDRRWHESCGAEQPGVKPAPEPPLVKRQEEVSYAPHGEQPHNHSGGARPPGQGYGDHACE